MADQQAPQVVKGLRLDRTPVDLEVSKLEWRPGAYALVFDD